MREQRCIAGSEAMPACVLGHKMRREGWEGGWGAGRAEGEEERLSGFRVIGGGISVCENHSKDSSRDRKRCLHLFLDK